MVVLVNRKDVASLDDLDVGLRDLAVVLLLAGDGELDADAEEGEHGDERNLGPVLPVVVRGEEGVELDEVLEVEPPRGIKGKVVDAQHDKDGADECSRGNHDDLLEANDEEASDNGNEHKHAPHGPEVPRLITIVGIDEGLEDHKGRGGTANGASCEESKVVQEEEEGGKDDGANDSDGKVGPFVPRGLGIHDVSDEESRGKAKDRKSKLDEL